MDEAMSELTFLATGLRQDPARSARGAHPALTPWKYGFKSAKAIVRIELVSEQPGTFWSSSPRGSDFFGNVDPSTPHPRWSQASERLIDDGRRIKTLPYNGYGEWVAKLYG